MKVKITLTEDMLGTSCANKEVHAEYIASKSADAEKSKEELAALPADTLLEKGTTVFPKDEDGTPILWDYQLKGFLKDGIGIQLELADKEIKIGKTKLSKWTYKRIVDNFVFVFPRKIRITGSMGDICTRPLRADTMQGERIALASSETVTAGSTFEVEIKCLVPALEELVLKCLDYGAMKGIGQWRNSGKGRFEWTEVK